MTILSEVIGKGVEADRPAFGRAGSLYYNEDDGIWEWDSGAAWVPTPVAASPTALDDLTNVNAPSPSDTQALVWDSATSKWISVTLTVPAHNHDAVYYTESEVDTLLGGKSATGHTHTITRVLTFGYMGTLVVGALAVRLHAPVAGVITNVTATVGVQPTGAAIIVDVEKNGTTIFTTSGNRPQIAVSTNDNLASVPDVTSVALDDLFTASIAQIGSTVAGSNLLIQIRYTTETE